MLSKRTPRDKQAGKVIVQLEGDRGKVLFPDGGAPALKIYIRKHQAKMSDGYGSHFNGKHKLG